MNIISKNIEVFPVAKPRVSSSNQTNGGRLFTEYYVSNIVRQLMGTSGFITNCYTASSDATSGEFDPDASFTVEFNIYGYYFKITDLQPSSFISDLNDKPGVLANGNYYVVATITDYDDQAKEIHGQDTKTSGTNEYRYGGLDVSVKTVENVGDKSLILFDLLGRVDESDGKLRVDKVSVHKPSYQKFSPESMYITGIDGKYE